MFKETNARYLLRHQATIMPKSSCFLNNWEYTELLFFFTFPSSGILETRKHDVSETGSVSVLRWKGGEDTYSVGPLWKANLNHWTPFHLRIETDPVSETSCFLVSRIPDDGKVKKNSNSVLYSIIRTLQDQLRTRYHAIVNERINGSLC
jgi:hypothetical protein